MSSYYQDLNSLRCSALLKLNQAEKFKDFSQIYFPYNLDFRGRAYPIPPHLSNIGSDLCRGMLTFSESKPLGDRGLYWLKVHLANLAGADKLTFDGRVEFVESNMDHVRASVEDPLGLSDETQGKNHRWWMTCEDPFQALAACYEIIQAIDSDDPTRYECSLPVHMDGSCNGLQHYAALGRDYGGGRSVNLCNTETPQDVYVGVMHKVIETVAQEAAIDYTFDDKPEDELTKDERKILRQNRGAKLVNGHIDRGVVKRTVMTSVYGVTYIGARKQIQEKIEEKVSTVR
jgi:DNA-directed RNA polymerase